MDLKNIKKDQKPPSYYAMGGTLGHAAPNTPAPKQRAQSRGKRSNSIIAQSEPKKVKVRDQSPSSSYKKFKLMTSKKLMPPKSIHFKHNLMTLGVKTPSGSSQQEIISLQLDSIETQKCGTSIMLEPAGESSRNKTKQKSISPVIPKLKKKKPSLLLIQQQQSAQTEAEVLQHFSQPQQKPKKVKKTHQPSQIENDVYLQNEYDSHPPKQQSEVKHELLYEFRELCRAEAQEAVKQAVAKIVYLKREIINEIKSQTPSAVAHGDRSTAGEYELVKERLDRAEAEITCLKDEQVTQLQIKKIQQDNLTICKDLVSKFKHEFENQIQQLEAQMVQVKQQMTQECMLTQQFNLESSNQLRQQLLADQAQHFRRFELQKQQFLDSVQSNMQVLDNLVQDYSKGTKEQITKQLLQSQTSQPQPSRNATDSKVLSMISDEIALSSRIATERSQMKHHHAVTERVKNSFEMVEIKRHRDQIDERLHKEKQNKEVIGPDEAELSSKQSSLQKSDYGMPYEEIKAEFSPHDKNIDAASSSNGLGGTGKIQLNDIGKIYLIRESQSMSLQQRREGAPNITRNQKSLSKGTTRNEPTDSDFFNLTQEDQSQGLLDAITVKQGSIIDYEVQVSPIPHKEKIQIIEPIAQKISKRSMHRIANEIIEQLYVDEVIFALDEVIMLAKDQIDTLISTQDQELINIQRVHFTEQLVNSNQLAPHDQSDRYELSISAQDFIPDMSRSDNIIEENSLESGATSQQPEVTGVEVEADDDLSRASDQDLEAVDQ